MSVAYIGEHLLPGQIGECLVWTALMAALVSAFLFFLRTRDKYSASIRLKACSRILYLLSTLAVTGVAVTLFYLILHHRFEYAYVWKYSSSALPLKYIISCFWAGQEGSFVVWAVFQSLIGLALIRVAGKRESSVMWIFTLANVMLLAMLPGIRLGSITVGNSPFALLREVYGASGNTIFQQADYLRVLGDGNGLNPLLENFWMIIHPPVLFLGYALTLAPFCYAAAALMDGDFEGWLKPVMPWILASLAFLGAGILLGGAWAYVSLTFGGFWSWDPVENSSLVPWMTLIAALHFVLVARRQHLALFSAFLLTMLSYVLVLFATCLTRSGALSETSVHSFGDNGLAGQLIINVTFFFILMIVLIIKRFRKITDHKQDVLLSKECWMFIGSIVITLAAFQLIFTTSVPLFNKLFGTSLAPSRNAPGFYNHWQMPFALLVAGFIAFSQFLHYRENKPEVFFRKLIVPFLIAAVLTVVITATGMLRQFNLVLFLFVLLFAIVSVLANIIFRTSKPRNMAAMITHVGFALFLTGVVITFSNHKTITSNTSGFDLGNERLNRENQLLLKGDTLFTGGFWLTYVNEERHGHQMAYRIDFLQKEKGRYHREFTLHPSVNVHPSMGVVYNPDTHHFFGKDYYAYLSAVGSAPDYVVIRAIMNPWINVMWTGAVVMMTGIGLAMFKRARKRKG